MNPLKAQSSDDGLTTVILIRHAEKTGGGTDPELVKRDMNGRQSWQKYSYVEFDAVYFTNYIRTRETAAPIAEDNNLSIREYDPNPKTEAGK